MFGVKTNLYQGTVIEMLQNGTLKINGKAFINKGSKVVIGKDATFEIGDST
jgi:hypothetical protein